MNNNSKEERKRITKPLKDLFITFILAILVFIFAAVFDAFEALVEWSQKYEKFEIDEIFILLVILSFAFALFSFRRWKELSSEIALRDQLQNELQKAHNELEKRVEERTAELSKANVSLRQVITERKQVDEALKNSEHDYRTLFDSTIDGLFVIEAETMKILFANQAAIKMFGIDSIEDAIETNPLDFIVPDDRDRVIRIILKDITSVRLRLL